MGTASAAFSEGRYRGQRSPEGDVINAACSIILRFCLKLGLMRPANFAGHHRLMLIANHVCASRCGPAFQQQS